MNYIGDFTEDSTVYIMFNTFTSNDPSASCTITNFTAGDVHIHKDDGLTQRNNAAGITVSVDFDGITGSHMVKIDTSDNTVAGFWVIGHEYFVRIEGTTIDGATINSVVGQFSIENRFNEVDVVKVSGDSTAADNLELDYNGTGYDKANSTIGTCTTNTDVTALNDISVADIIAGIADGSYDLQEMIRLIFSACCLKVSGGGTTILSFRDSADGKDRIVEIVDEDGNRTSITLDGS